jgi:hypothetical protein
MRRTLSAFILGFISLPLSFAIGEPLLSNYGGSGLTATFIVMAVYFFVCQFFLSRGKPDALFKNWPIMLALDATQLIMLILVVLLERLEVILSQGLGILLSCCGGTLAGAFVASQKARRKAKAETS